MTHHKDRKFVEEEFQRMGFDKDSRWRISAINQNFELCNTYPRFLILPSAFKDEDLEFVAKFRYFRRIPTAVWKHTKNGCFIVRSSQPTVGWFGWFRNELDENLVQSYVNNTMPPLDVSTSPISKSNGPYVISTSGSEFTDNNSDPVESKYADNGDGGQANQATTQMKDSTLTIKQLNGNTSDELSERATRVCQNSIVDLQTDDTSGMKIDQSEVDDDSYVTTGADNSPSTDVERSAKPMALKLSEKSSNDQAETFESNICSNNNELIETNSSPNLETTSLSPQPTNGNRKTPLTRVKNLSLASNHPSSGPENDAPDMTTTTTEKPITDSTTISETTNNSTSSKMLIIDARSYTAAMANRAKGGGCECSEYYQRCEVHFMNLANIHSIRKSYHAIRSVCEAYSEQSNNWLSILDNSRWLHHISGLIKSALLVVDTIDVEEKSIMIHCSDGWDRTAQLVALAEIMLDSHYRTFEGFRTLIQREWLDFGHKFADRCGSNPCNDDPNERCPVFLQWLDCVQQLLVQFPKHFEFNSAYLDKLNRHTYSNVFGTFSYNCSQERAQNKVDENTPSLWAYFDSARDRYKNENYVESDDILRPSYKVRDLHFWKEVYLPPIKGNQVAPTNSAPFVPISASQQTMASTTAATSNTGGVDSGKCCDALHMDGLTRTVCK